MRKKPDLNAFCRKGGRLLLVTLTTLTLTLTSCNAALSSAQAETPLIAAEIFVSPDGNDGGAGTLRSPFLTLERAKKEVRKLLKAGAGRPVTVNIRGGEYYISKTLSFTAEDSGTAEAPVTWQAYNGEKVLLSGGIKLAPSQARRVTDPAILARVLDGQAAQKLLQIDLSGYVYKFEPLISPGTASGIQNCQYDIYINGKPLTLARWPNDEPNAAYVRALAAVSDGGGNLKLTCPDAVRRAARWAPAALNSLHIYGYMATEWLDGIYKVDAPDAGAQTLTVRGVELNEDMLPRFYFIGLPEEIDVPGESYIDRENKVIYFYPPCGLKGADIYLSFLDEDMINLHQAKNIVFEGLDMKYMRGSALTANGVDNIVIGGCAIAHTGMYGFDIKNAVNCTVKNSSVYDTFHGSVISGGSDRARLEPSENVIENNRFYHNYRLAKAYNGALSVDSVGVVIKNNKISGSPHLLMHLGASNDALIEYNEICEAVLETSDAGAIYYDTVPSLLGLRIRHNYFHDIGNTYGGLGQNAIYADNATVMPQIYGNIFRNASDKMAEWSAPVKANGAQFGEVRNNIFIDSPLAANFESWGEADRNPPRQEVWLMAMYDMRPGPSMWKMLTEDVDFFSGVWREHYRGTQWEKMWNYLSRADHDKVMKIAAGDGGAAAYKFLYERAPARTNLFTDNVCVMMPGIEGQMFFDNGRGGNNYVSAQGLLPTGVPLFADLPGENFALTAQGLAAIRAAVPGFQDIPVGDIGIQPYSAFGKTLLPGGREPSVSGVRITAGSAGTGALRAAWDYADPDGVSEGASVVNWYISASPGGGFTKIADKHDNELWLVPAWSGKYIRCEVIPCNRNMLYGNPVLSPALRAGTQIAPPNL